MNTPIPPVVLMELPSPAAVQPGAPAAPDAAQAALGQRFEQLMNRTPAETMPRHAEPTHLGNALQSLDRAHHRLDVDMLQALQAAPGLDARALGELQMSLSMRMAVASAQLTMSTGLVQSGKNGLNTLMKNQ